MIWLLHTLVFASAFLLFQVELIAAKALLPGFGGSYQVWGAAVMTFQGLLLLGYAAAQQMETPRGRWLRWALCAAFAAGFATFPTQLAPFSHPDYARPAAFEVAWTLLRTVGLAFLCLAPISILAQSLLAGSQLKQRANPYALYATSSLGSFAGLLSYPFLIEPHFLLPTQLFHWRDGFGTVGALLLLCLIGLRVGRPAATAAPGSEAVAPPAGPRRTLAWLVLSAASSLLFLATTNLITFDIASAPLLWILPLGLYLLSFALTFKKNPWYPEWIRARFPLAAALGVFLFLMAFQSYRLPTVLLVAIHLLVLFAVCVVCNGELHRARPADPARLPAFYLYIALGGFIGGALASWIAPLLSDAVIEYPLGFFLVGLGLCLSGERARPRIVSIVLAGCAAPATATWFALVSSFGLRLSSIFAALAGFFLALIFYGLRRRPFEIALCLGLVVLMVPALTRWQPGKNMLHTHRNFYGIYRVYDAVSDASVKRQLQHGTTLHGSQYLDPSRQHEALAYYHASAPAGELLSSGLFDFQRIGIVGLGAGSLAVYGKPGQEMDFYELDTYNELVARRYFTFLKLCKANLRLLFGDGRLGLARAKDGGYGLLIIDAFNSDAIPTHLLTVEAFAEYARCVGPDGLILLHISNKFMHLAPVVQANARMLGLRALIKRVTGAAVHPDAEACVWAALTSDEATARILAGRLGWTDTAVKPEPAMRPWTDQYSNILDVLQ